jgi:hypothetical protein
VILTTGNYAEAGRAVGITRVSARSLLLKTEDGLQRLALIARASDAVVAEAMDASRRAVRANKALLTNPDVAPKAAAAINDSLRSATQARVAIAKLTGEHAAERHEVSVTTLSDAELDARIRELEGSDRDG